MPELDEFGAGDSRVNHLSLRQLAARPALSKFRIAAQIHRS
jgi:hypothetical protein